MLQGKTSSVFTLSLLLTIAASPWLPAAFLTNLALAQTPPASFSLPDSVPRGTAIRIDGSDSMTVINQALKQKFEAEYQGTTVNLAAGGTAAALRAVLDGTVDLAAIGRPLTQAEKAQGLVEVPITREKIAIIVGPDNPFRGNITFDQFARIFRGEITDWSQLGGAPGRIRFVDRPESSDTRQAFRNYKIFQVAPFQTGSNVAPLSQDNTAEVIASLGRDGISYAIANQVTDQPNVRIVSMHGTLPDDPRYPFSQPRGYVYRGTPSAAVQSFLGFATAPIGQTAIAQAKAAEAGAVAAAIGGNISSTASPNAASSTSTAASGTGGTGAGATGSAGTGISATGAASPPATSSSTASSPAAASSTPSTSPSPGAIAPGAATGTASPGATGAVGTTGTVPGTVPSTVPGTVPGTADIASADPTAANPSTEVANRAGGLGWLPWLLLPLALLGGLLLWRSRRRPTEAAPPPVSPAAPVVPPAAGETGAAGTTLAQRTGSVVSADRLEIMSDAPGAAVSPQSIEVPAAAPEVVSSETIIPSPEAAQPIEPATTAIDAETVEEIPSAAIDPAIPSAAIDPALLGGAALAAGTGALFGLSELRDQSETKPETIDSSEGLLSSVESVESEFQPGFVESEPLETALSSQAMAAELVAPPAPDVVESPEEIAAEEEIAADLLAERDVAQVPKTSIDSEPSLDSAPSFGTTLPLAAAAAAGMYVAQSRVPSEETQDDEAQTAIEASKFNVGQTDLSAEELATVDANLPDLPGGYGESQIVLLPRDPQWAYAYWDVPAEQKQLARQQGGTRFALRFYDVTNIDFSRHNPHSLQQYECDEMARNWYIPVPLSDRDYIAEIGYATEDGRWIMLARSLPIRIPPVYPSDWNSEQFLTLDWQSDLRGRQFAELSPGERTTFDNPIYDRIFGLTESAEAQRVAGSLFGSMQQVPEQTISSFSSGAGLSARTESGIGMSGMGMYSMSGIGMSGVGMYTTSGIGMSGVGMYTMSGFGMMSGVGFSASMPPMRPRQFWLVADAELIVYGATEPNATVTIAGRPVQLNPDGTFRFQMSFQDGVIDFPILAVASDGEQTRSVHLNFERKTPSRNTNTKDEAQDEWFPG